jgi:diguanylate cyclase (GGDEF)-like protein
MTKARKREEAAEQAVALLGEVAAGYYGGDPSANPSSMLALPPAPPPYIPEPIEHPNLGYTPIELPGGAMLPTGEGYEQIEEEGSNRRFRRGSRRRRRRARMQAEAEAARYEADYDPTATDDYDSETYATDEYSGEPHEGLSPYDGIAEAIHEVTEDARLTGADSAPAIAFEWSADLDHFVDDPPARDVAEEAPFPLRAAGAASYDPAPTARADDLAALPNATLADETLADETVAAGTATPAAPPAEDTPAADAPATPPAAGEDTPAPVGSTTETTTDEPVDRRQGVTRPRPVVAPKSERVERLERGLELVYELDQLWSMSARAINQVTPASNAQLLTSDEGGALGQTLSVGPDAWHHGCSVPDREMCPAMRLDKVMRFESSALLDACPFLAIREDGPISAVCIPFHSQRSLAGVLHTTAPVDAPTSDEHVDELTVALALIGKRTHEIADGTSEGTGTELLESTIDELVQQGTRFAVALVHLDNFRLYNRAHGLDIGDAAVQRFDQVARRVVRPEDLVAGDGGDEFFLVFPHTTAKGAAVVCDRIRSELASSFVDNGVPRFTVSIGVADTDDGETFDELLAVIERAVVHAEAAGHDLVVSTKVLAARREDNVQDLASR